MAMKVHRIYKIYLELYQKHGHPKYLWPQWCAIKKDNALRETIALGAILTQQTSWYNVNLAFKNLREENLLSFEKIASLTNLKKLAKLIKPTGFYQTKPKRLFTFASFIMRQYGGLERFGEENLESAREQLLNLYGIGPETADSILLYALDKSTFVIDEYTRRLVRQKKISNKLDYDYLKRLFEKNLPRDLAIFQNYHALIIIDQRGKEQSLMEAI